MITSRYVVGGSHSDRASSPFTKLTHVMAGCLSAAGQLEKAREALSVAHQLVPHSKAYEGMLHVLGEEIESKRKTAKWDELMAEISKIDPPQGGRFGYFRDRKIQLHFYLSTTGDLEGVKRGLAALQLELATENRIDAPAQITLSADNSPPTSTAQIVVVPEKARYTTIDGQTIEALAKSPEHLELFLREQRIFDKMVEVQMRRQEAAGVLPSNSQISRPTSINFSTPPGMTRAVRLRMIEEELDETLKAQEGENPLRQIPAPSVLTPSALPQEFQNALDLINNANALNHRSHNGPGLPSHVPPEAEMLRLINSPSGNTFK